MEWADAPGGPGGSAGEAGSNRKRHDVAFDTDGNPVATEGPGGGPGGPDFGHDRPFGHGPDGGPPGGRPAAGEKFGDAVWTNFPVDIVHRPGLRMGELTAAERDAAHGLLQAVLSPIGYQKVLDIMAADQAVSDAGADYASGYNSYTIAMLGSPVPTSPWMLQFGGHHLGSERHFCWRPSGLCPAPHWRSARPVPEGRQGHPRARPGER